MLAITTAHYRPVYLFLVPAVSSMIKAMSIIKPSRPLSAPSWNLQIVHDYTEGMPRSLSFMKNLAKATFLLSWPLVGESLIYIFVSDYKIIAW